MMWGCMLWEGAGMACQIDGIMDGDCGTATSTQWQRHACSPGRANTG
jgi:hypothetical protein